MSANSYATGVGFYYENGTVFSLPSAIWYGTSITTTGYVLGYDHSGNEFLMNPSGVTSQLAPLSYAGGIAADGTLAGDSLNSAGTRHPFVFTGGVFTNLNSVLATAGFSVTFRV